MGLIKKGGEGFKRHWKGPQLDKSFRSHTWQIGSSQPNVRNKKMHLGFFIFTPTLYKPETPTSSSAQHLKCQTCMPLTFTRQPLHKKKKLKWPGTMNKGSIQNFLCKI